MTVKCSYDVTAESSGAPSRLWSLLIDARSWPRWGPVDSLVLEQSEGISPDGRDEVGAVRAFRTGRTVTTDRIVALDPCRRLAYEVAFGLHFVMRRTMNRTMQRVATGLARARDVNPG